MKKISGNFQALKLAAKLFLVFCLGSILFGVFLSGLGSDEWASLRPDEKFAVIGVFFLISTGVEIFIYSRFYRQWRLFFLNFAIAHFAAFFGTIGGFIAAIADMAYILPGFVVVWFPIAYFCQYHLIYVEKIEQRLKELDEKVGKFEQEKAAINAKIAQLKTQQENRQRFGN
jgi:hypothetical protein